MQAVAISVADKRAMARELRRVLRTGGRLAFFDSFARGDGELHFPLPWADGPEGSFVVGAGELRSGFEAEGFEPVVWNEQELALAEIGQRSFTRTVELGDVQRMSASRKAVRIASIDIGVHRSDRRARVGKLTAKAPRTCAGRSMKPPCRRVAPAAPTTPTTSRSRPAD